MKTRYKIVIPIIIMIAMVFVFSNPFSPGYFLFPWNQENDTYCWSYFMAYHEEPIDKLALNIHIRNQIAQHGMEYNVPWRNIEIKDFDANNLHIMVTGNWHGSYVTIDDKLTLQSIILTDDIAKFEGLKTVEKAQQICA